MAAPIEIDVWQGDIAGLEVDAIVVSATESLFMNAGPAAAVMRRGGEEIERAAVEQGPVAAGSAVVTGAGSLAAPYVIHAVAVGHDRVADLERLAAAVHSVLALVAPLQLRRIATGLLGVEHGAFEPAQAARALVSAIATEAPAPLESVVVATTSAAETRAVNEAIATHRSGVR
jgi:O-acetyl-ADP-ribose deacetylase (regulator of RNase III)